MKNNLKKARDLFSKGKYNGVLRLLEPLIFDYSESKTFFYLLGYSCLFSLDFHGAQSYLSKLMKLDPRNIDGLLGIALIHMKREELKEAATHYLRVLEYEPNSREAKAGLKYLRGNRDDDRILQFFDNGKFVKLLPRHTRKRSLSVTILSWFAITLISCFVLGTGVLYFYRQTLKPERPELQDINILDIESYTAADTESTVVLNDEQIKVSLKNILRYMDSYRDNMARVEINKLLLSNSSEEVKEKARVLNRVLKEPSFTTIKDVFSYEQVIEFPQLYNGCYVIWTGRAANISITEEKIAFSLLVGYEKGDVLEGVVPAYITFSTAVYQNMPVELLAELETNEKSIQQLRVVSVHRLLNDETIVK